MDSSTHRGPLVMDIFAPKPPPVDRRNATRQVSMKLLCLGLSRTGTSSLREALFRLGYDDVYHQTNLNQNDPYDAQMWVDAYRNRFESATPWTTERWKSFFDAVLGHCMAVSDVPCATFWRELMEAYPDAKVLVTVRDSPEAWYDSFMQTSINMLGPLLGNGVLPWLIYMFMPPRASMEYARLLLKYDDAYHSCFQDHMRGSQNGVEAYNRHHNAIKALAKKQGREVLFFNVKQGWDPLCKFLGLNQPKGSFPRLNDKTYFLEGTATLHKMTMIGVAISAGKRLAPWIAVAGALWFGTRMLRA